MPIILNGTGTISGLTAGGLPSSSVTTANIADNAVTYAKIGTTEQGQLCKAWVNFNGTSTVAIRASYNVSSITDNGTGDYTVNYTSALTDANYSVAAMGQRGDAAGFGNYGFFAIQGTSSNTLSPTASSIRLNTMNAVGSALDYPAVFVSIFR